MKFQDNSSNSLRDIEVQSQTLGHQTAIDKGKPRTYRWLSTLQYLILVRGNAPAPRKPEVQNKNKKSYQTHVNAKQ